uniref:Autophagy-related protein 9 n=1 Tax=Heterorhabditis bacteriophora TaxID=37862 RepID=A0A1I7XIB3_HETBA
MPELHSHPDDHFGINESVGEAFRSVREHQSTPQALKTPHSNQQSCDADDLCTKQCLPCYTSMDNDSVPTALVTTNAITPRAIRGIALPDDVSPGLNKTQFRRVDYENKNEGYIFTVAMNSNGEDSQRYISKDEGMVQFGRPVANNSFEKRRHPAAAVLTNMLQQRYRYNNVSQSTTTSVSSPQITMIQHGPHLTDENANILVQTPQAPYDKDDRIISREAVEDLRKKNGVENVYDHFPPNELMSSTCTPSERTTISSPYKWQVRDYRCTTQIKNPDARWEDKRHRKLGSTVRRHIPRGHIRDLAAAFDQMSTTATKEAAILVHKTKSRVRRQSEPNQNDSMIMRTEDLAMSKDDSIIDHHQAYGGSNDRKFIVSEGQYSYNPVQSKVHLIKHNRLNDALMDIADEYDVDLTDSHADNRRTSTPLDIATDQNDHLATAFGRVPSIRQNAPVVLQNQSSSLYGGNCVRAIAANFEHNMSAERTSSDQNYSSSMKRIHMNQTYGSNTQTKVSTIDVMGSNNHTSSIGHSKNMNMQPPQKRRIEYNNEEDQAYAQVYRTDSSRLSKCHTSQTNDYVTIQRDGYIIDEENLNGQIDRMFEFVDEHDGLSTVDRERFPNDISSRVDTIHQEQRNLNSEQIYRKDHLKYSVSGYRNLQRQSRYGTTVPSSDSAIRFSRTAAPLAGHSVSTYRSREGTIGKRIDATSYTSRTSPIGRPSALATSTPMDSPIGTVHTAIRMEDSFVSSITTASHDPTVEYKRQINKLNHQLRTQEEQIEMTLKVLVLARKKQKSMQELSAQRTLLVARERVDLLRREIKRISALSAVRHPPPPINRDLRGSMFISNITVHLNRNFCQRQPDINASYAFVVLLKCGAEVEATGPVSLLAHHQMRVRQLHFAENVRFSNLPVDFTVLLEVYAMKLSEVKTEELSCASTIANKCRNLLTPVARKANRSGIDQPLGDFVRCGYIVLNRDTVGTSKFYLDDAEYPLEGTIEVYSRCTTLPPAIEVDNRGFLTMYQTISGMASWERYWAVLRRGMVFFWKYPDDERMDKNPVAHMDLTKCTNEELIPCSAEQCPRPFAFSIDILVCTTPSIMEKKRVLLSADSRELLQAWLQAFNETLLRIDDDYEDSDVRGSTCDNILPIVSTGRSILFGGGGISEAAPLIAGSSSTVRDGYHSPPINHRAAGQTEDISMAGNPPAMASSSRGDDHRWDHIENLDQFFTRVYEYHQGGGFMSISVKKVFNLVQFIFIVVCLSFKYIIDNIQMFYNSALLIEDAQLSNLTWHAVVKRICDVQPRLQLMIHRDQLSSIDLYNRILRFKNYFVALINMRKLPPVFHLPFFGEVTYLPNGLKTNIKRFLFYSSSSPWDGPYLKDEYKNPDNIDMLTRQMEKNVALYGLLNLVFFPLIFLYQILYSFFTLSELIKRRPDALGMRRYSNYGRYRVRHFNELDHELAARLNRSHFYANAYLNQFFSPLTEILAKNIAFIAGAVAGVLTILSAWDEDVLQVEHVLTVISICGVILIACHGMISDENLVWQPEVLLTHVTSELHYVPTDWKGKAHTDQVRHQFEQLFQLKWMFLLQELSSPLLTPFVLLFWIRPQCRNLVLFFHHNTVRVSGLGDICSFALMDVGRHGDPQWNKMDSVATAVERDSCEPALDGKTELSVLHFASTNPEWKPPPASEQFLHRFKARLERDALAIHPSTLAGERNLLLDSVHSLIPSVRPSVGRNPLIGDGLHRVDGPLTSVGGVLSSLPQINQQSIESLTQSLRKSVLRTQGPVHSVHIIVLQPGLSVSTGEDGGIVLLESEGIDFDSAGSNMRLQTLFLRELHDESMRRSSLTVGYGASMAPHHTQSVFGVPQLSQIDDSIIDNGLRSRLVLRHNVPETHEEREEEEDIDDDRPPQFMNEILEEGNLSDDSLNEQSQAMIKQSVETDEICDDNEDVSVTFRKELANLPLSQVRKLKEQIGLKLFNKAYFGTTKQNKNSEGDNNDKIVEQHVKRKGQHRPKEISSKTHVSTFRNIYPKDKSEKRRWDPRFDCRTGDYKEHCFEDNYSFLEELRSNEKNKALKIAIYNYEYITGIENGVETIKGGSTSANERNGEEICTVKTREQIGQISAKKSQKGKYKDNEEKTKCG